MRCLLVRPRNHGDSVAQRLFEFCAEIKAHIEKYLPSSIIADLTLDSAVRAEFETIIKKGEQSDIGLFVFYGHGGYDQLTGYNNSAIADTLNAPSLCGWHIYTVACYSMQQLGPFCIKHGVLSYIGYKNEYVVPHGITCPTGWRESANAGIMHIKENGVYDCWKAYHDLLNAYDYWIKYYIADMSNQIMVSPPGTFQLAMDKAEEMLNTVIRRNTYNAWLLNFNKQSLACLP